MPAAIQPNAGKIVALWTLAMNNLAKIHLFTNNMTPGPATVWANMVEPSFTGYVSPVFNLDSMPTVDAAGQATGTKGTITYTNSGASNVLVYGWFITLQDTAGNPQVWFVKLFDSPQTLVANGGTLNFQITLNAGDITPA
jgi:hypothetical protein